MAIYLPLYIAEWAFFILGLLVASIYDLKCRRVPNWINFSILCVGSLAQLMTGGLTAWGWSLIGFIVGVALLIIPFARHWIGGGDVKLFAALGTWLGPRMIFEVLLAGAIWGGLLSAIYWLVASRDLRRSIFTNLINTAYLRRMPDVEHRSKRHSLPYSLALALGAFTVLGIHWRNLVQL